MNRLILIGRLTKNPEIKRDDEGSASVGRYTLAVDRKYKKNGEKETDFIEITVFGKAAEFASKYLFKGMQIAVTAKVQNNNYVNKSGEKIYGYRFVAEEQEFVERKKESPADVETENEDLLFS